VLPYSSTAPFLLLHVPTSFHPSYADPHIYPFFFFFTPVRSRHRNRLDMPPVAHLYRRDDDDDSGTTTGLIWAGAVIAVVLDVVLAVYLYRRYHAKKPSSRRVRGFTRLPHLSLRVAVDVARSFALFSKPFAQGC
jgi:hypothetical protein